MPSDIVIKDNFSGLDKFQKSFKENKVAKVGIFSDKNARDDAMTNVKVGMKHEFGSFSEGIPRRSFLRDPMTFKRKELLKQAKKIIDRDIDKGIEFVLEKIGVLGETIVQEAFATGGFGAWQPLSDTTIKKKNSSSVLIDTGQLRRAIISKVDSNDS
jgi:hypothetical protein